MTAPARDPVIKVLLVGSQSVSLAGLRALINNESDMEVVGQREHPKDTAAAPPSEPPDVALVDYADQDTLAPLTAMATAAARETRVLMVTNSTDTALLSSVFRLGARGVVSKHQTPEVLIDAIHAVHAGEMWLDRPDTTRLITDLVRRSKTAPRARRATVLTGRDHRIIALLAEGRTNGQIAEALCVSEATVRNRLTVIFKTLGVTGRLQLVVYACQHGLAKMPQKARRRGARNTLRLV